MTYRREIAAHYGPVDVYTTVPQTHIPDFIVIKQMKGSHAAYVDLTKDEAINLMEILSEMTR